MQTELNNIKNLHDSMQSSIDNAPYTFGIGTPGSVSARTGLLKGTNTVCLNKMPIKADLEGVHRPWLVYYCSNR